MQIAIGVSVGGFTKAASAPIAPSGLSVGSATTSALALTWTDNSANETGFEVERSANGSTGWTNIATTAANATSYQNTGLSAGTTYYYRVRAVNATGNSSYTSVANGTTTSVANALTLVSKTTPAAGFDGGTTVNVPAGVSNGDILIMTWGASGNPAPTLSGWTLIDSLVGTNVEIYAWYRIASSEPASYTISHGFAWCSGCMIAYRSGTGRSITPGTPAHQYNMPGASKIINFPSVTALENAKLICVGITYGNAGGVTPHTGMTEEWELDGSSTLTHYMMDQTVSSGSTGTKTATTVTARESAVISLTICEVV